MALTRHPDLPLLLDFVERSEHRSEYVLTTLAWLRDRYPGSVAEAEPRLRAAYRTKRSRETTAPRHTFR